MKFERTLFKISIKETVLLAIFYIVVLNFFVLVISMIAGRPFITFVQKSWIMLVIYPLLLPILQTSIDRNGVLKFDGLNDLPEALKKIDFLLKKKGYTVVNQNTREINYVKKAKFDQFFNFILKNDVQVTSAENEVKVFGKRQILMAIEYKLKY
ncbi:MAG: hypothetical protein WCP85_10685 [Mariniphaga sp.]